MKPECLVCGNCVEITRSGTALNGRELSAFCFYCMSDTFKFGARKIGNKASWTGRTPSWCPAKKGVVGDV